MHLQNLAKNQVCAIFYMREIWENVFIRRGHCGGGGGYPIPQYRKKNWQIPKYRVKNRRNTDTAFIFGHAYLKLYPSRVFVYSKHLCTSNQPQPLRGNVRRPRIDRYNDRKRYPTNFIIDYLSEIV